MQAKLFTTTKYRVYKNRGGMFVPQYSNKKDVWEPFYEQKITVMRAYKSFAFKFILRKAARFYLTEDKIAYVEWMPPVLTTEQQEEAEYLRSRIAHLSERMEDPTLRSEAWDEMQSRRRSYQMKLWDMGISID